MTAVLTWRSLLLREPVYQGGRLSHWLTSYRLHGVAGVESWQVRLAQQEADEAVRHVGTNALRTLLRMLRTQDSGLKARFAGLLARQQLIPVTYISAEEKHYRACWAFGVLRAKARTAMPALIKIASQNPSRDARLGADPSVFMPAVVESLREPDYTFLDFKLGALLKYKDQAQGAVPILSKILTSAASLGSPTNQIVRQQVTAALRQLQLNRRPESAQPSE